MSYSREKVLAYKSHDLIGDMNSLLHDLILVNDVVNACKIIQDDMAARDGCTIVNAVSCGNTPLMLSLKKGAAAIAMALLQHPQTDIHKKDDRGFSPLHWACMLRLDSVIILLLDRGADPNLKTLRWVNQYPGADEFDPLTPLALYRKPVESLFFAQFYTISCQALRLSHRPGEFMDKYPQYYEMFFRDRTPHIGTIFLMPYVDRPDLYIPGEIAYTDLIFHMKDVCKNLGWCMHNSEFVDFDNRKILRTCDMYRINFGEGMYAFCHFRNKVPVNEMLLARMQEKKAPPSVKSQPDTVCRLGDEIANLSIR